MPIGGIMDAILLILALLAVSVPFVIAGLWWWFWFWIILAAVLAIIELVAKLVTGKTISQQFWAWRKDPATSVWKKWLILGGMIAFWVYLLSHLFL
jgi:phosphatidylglycerophosphate synthase